MICPFMSNADKNADCEREKCAWWERKNERCIVKSIDNNLELLEDATSATNNTLEKINKISREIAETLAEIRTGVSVLN